MMQGCPPISGRTRFYGYIRISNAILDNGVDLRGIVSAVGPDQDWRIA
jgi:hypothetical protein